MSKIQQSIEKLLQKHRILLWYDAEYLYKLNPITYLSFQLILLENKEIEHILS